MNRPFVLCDPGLLIPPTPEDSEEGLRFWPQLISWANDRRLRLGPAGQQLIYEAFCDMGWPTFEPPACPPALQRGARRALNLLLAQVIDAMPVSVAPELQPAYAGATVAAGEAIARDAASAHPYGLMGLATCDQHWPEDTVEVRLDPPPPEVLPFALEPAQQLPGEVDRCVAAHLARRRLTIVGGEYSDSVVESLVARFGIAEAQVTWIESEPNQRINLDALDGLKSERDIVYCITGFIGHDGSTATARKCRRRGVPLREVRYSSRIASDLCTRHGEDVHEADRLDEPDPQT